MEGGLVSLVIPTFNRSRYLRQAIDSVLAQDYPNIELIVIDDGSTDNTREVLESYGDAFRWESRKNSGQSAALNYGWSISRGEFLGYLGDDDALLPAAVSRAVATLDARADAVAVYPDYELMDPNSIRIRRVFAPEYDYDEMICGLVCAPGPGVLFRRSAYEVAGPWNPGLRYIPDFDFWLRLGRSGPFVRIPEVLATFRVHEQSQSFLGLDSGAHPEWVAVLSQYLADFPVDPRAAKKGLARAHLLEARSHLRSMRWKPAARSLWRSITLDARGILSLRAVRLLFNALFNRFGHRLWWRLQTRKRLERAG